MVPDLILQLGWRPWVTIGVNTSHLFINRTSFKFDLINSLNTENILLLFFSWEVVSKGMIYKLVHIKRTSYEILY